MFLVIRSRRGKRSELGRGPQGPQAAWGKEGPDLRER